MPLVDKIIFGPVKSRRLGNSLGINLLPADAKICSFNCIYCECGFNTKMNKLPIPEKTAVKEALKASLIKLRHAGVKLDSITFSGNGEPTLHPDFEKIIDDVMLLRNEYFPQAKVSVFSNSTQIDKISVFKALNKIDNNILKFDAAVDETMRIIDQPVNEHFNVKRSIELLSKFNGNLIIQTLFLRGWFDGRFFDNTTALEVERWLNAMEQIRPKQIMIYSLDRATPADKLEKITPEKLEEIAEKARRKGFDVLTA
jgi:wyosine [tRNA(Phe)-imidazoG37] synthetase (radical SAM superfamily)